jgi:hypothetical protein
VDLETEDAGMVTFSFGCGSSSADVLANTLWYVVPATRCHRRAASTPRGGRSPFSYPRTRLGRVTALVRWGRCRASTFVRHEMWVDEE